MEIKLGKILDIFQFANKYVKIANKNVESPIKSDYRQ